MSNNEINIHLYAFLRETVLSINKKSNKLTKQNISTTNNNIIILNDINTINYQKSRLRFCLDK